MSCRTSAGSPAICKPAVCNERPPIVLLTRRQPLPTGEAPPFLDATVHADKEVPGTRYRFLALTGTTT